MSSTSAPQPPGEASVPAQPTTQEIPVGTPATQQQLPPHPAAITPAAVPSVHSTGPVGSVPGLPGAPLPPPPAAPAPGPAAVTPLAGATSWPDSLATGPVAFHGERPHERSGERSSGRSHERSSGRSGSRSGSGSGSRVARNRTALAGLGLVAACLVLLQLGLGLRFGGESFWSDIPLWSAFATLCAVLGSAAPAALLPRGGRLGAGTAWRVAAGGLVGLAAFWVLVVLPVVASDRGFLLTAALACLGAALWTGPARKG